MKSSGGGWIRTLVDPLPGHYSTRQSRGKSACGSYLTWCSVWDNTGQESEAFGGGATRATQVYTELQAVKNQILKDFSPGVMDQGRWAMLAREFLPQEDELRLHHLYDAGCQQGIIPLNI